MFKKDRVKDNSGCRADAYIPIRGDAGTDLGMDIPERDSRQIYLARGGDHFVSAGRDSGCQNQPRSGSWILIRVTIQHHNTCKPPWPMHGFGIEMSKAAWVRHARCRFVMARAVNPAVGTLLFRFDTATARYGCSVLASLKFNVELWSACAS